MQLRVWKDSIELFQFTYQLLEIGPFVLGKVIANELSSVDSIHRNIAEGYCRKTTRDYLQFLNYSKASLGEAVSGMIALRKIQIISKTEFEEWNSKAFKIENGMIKLIQSLEKKLNS